MTVLGEKPDRRILPVTGHKFFLLFLFLLADLAIYPYVGDTGALSSIPDGRRRRHTHESTR